MRLLRIYPASWRRRYGDELAALIEELDGNARMAWHVRLDVVRAGLAERVHPRYAGGRSPRERARDGSLLVLYAWMLFVLGGFGVQRASEQWQAVTPVAKRGLPTAAFDVLFVAAGIGSALVLFGVAVLLPRLTVTIRRDGWAAIRRPIIRAGLVSVLTVAATFGLARWAHSLTPAARNGHDAAYTGAFLAWVALFAACLFTWAAAAAATARHLSWSPAVLRVEVWIGATVTAAMAVMTIATALWWGSLTSAAAPFWNVMIPAGLMFCATALGLTGATRAVRALADVSRPLTR